MVPPSKIKLRFYLIGNIIVFGRSIGTGPAVYLSSVRDIGLMCLISPFTSLKEIVGSTWGIMGRLAQFAVAEQFENLKHIKNTKAPVFIIHGIED